MKSNFIYIFKGLLHTWKRWRVCVTLKAETSITNGGRIVKQKCVKKTRMGESLWPEAVSCEVAISNVAEPKHFLTCLTRLLLCI